MNTKNICYNNTPYFVSRVGAALYFPIWHVPCQWSDHLSCSVARAIFIYQIERIVVFGPLAHGLIIWQAMIRLHMLCRYCCLFCRSEEIKRERAWACWFNLNGTVKRATFQFECQLSDSTIHVQITGRWMRHWGPYAIKSGHKWRDFRGKEPCNPGSSWNKWWNHSRFSHLMVPV